MGRIGDYSQYRIDDIEHNLKRIEVRPLDIMVTGATGAGKSTTLNRLFERAVTTVGEGVDPQTMEITAYSLNQYLRLWDTPGLGDGPAKDKVHKKNMTELLGRSCLSDDGAYKQSAKSYTMPSKDYAGATINPVLTNAAEAFATAFASIMGSALIARDSYYNYRLIDLALVIVDGSRKDLGTTYTLLNDVILPHIPSNRVLVAINKADFAMKGRNWDPTTCQPNSQLLSFLDEQSDAIWKRIQDATCVRIPRPIFYSAEYGYHIDRLLDFIIDHIPSARLTV